MWSGDVNGQGWGIDRSRGGMAAFRTMLDLRPDLFVHVGDTIYADEPMPETHRVVEDGSLWRNELDRGRRRARRDPRELPRPAPLLAARRQRARLPRRRSVRRAVGRPRDLQQLVPRRDRRRRPLQRAVGRRAGGAWTAGLAGVPAGAGEAPGPRRRRRLRAAPDLPQGPARAAPRPLPHGHAQAGAGPTRTPIPRGTRARPGCSGPPRRPG
ncbi:hypothetical protein G5V59_12175 [Nocardioides sp. W3-2-3]|nr:hypothetical protein [Nocardioides convexus]